MYHWAFQFWHEINYTLRKLFILLSDQTKGELRDSFCACGYPDGLNQVEHYVPPTLSPSNSSFIRGTNDLISISIGAIHCYL